MLDQVKTRSVEMCDVEEDCVLVLAGGSWDMIGELGRLGWELEDTLLVNTLALSV
jgi:hypothetical protein